MIRTLYRSRQRKRMLRVLDDAYSDVEANGLLKASYDDSRPNAPKCMVGAVNYAASGLTTVTHTWDMRHTRARRLIRRILDELRRDIDIGGSYYWYSTQTALTRWSDRHTQPEVLALLRRTRVRLAGDSQESA